MKRIIFSTMFVMLIFCAFAQNVKRPDSYNYNRGIEAIQNNNTDGIVIFTKPQDFTCEKKELTDSQITIFELESKNIGTITLYSDYETDFSLKNFNSHWPNWQDQDAAKLQSENVINKKRYVNSHSYFYKVTKCYIKDGELFWQYIFLTDEEHLLV